MQYEAVIFDMDGLLIDSEPQWQEAGRETLEQYGHKLSDKQYHTSTGLRTEEWIEHWFRHFNIDMINAPAAIDLLVKKAIEKIEKKGKAFAGIDEIFQFFTERNFRMGLATSSPMALVDVVIKKLKLHSTFDTIASAGELPDGKPHPQVYINCAAQLNCPPLHCIAFEDSFHGMIAAKAAMMKCVIIPAAAGFDHPKWNAADLKLRRLSDFREEHLHQLSGGS
ncbi:MAG: hexitol phosphatase HxpB [Chitinophagaceae bacterium]|nr:hexitol phosphatase HxpB [Chitinophagaceae bacterium]